ncbi:MAG: LysR family transcriptional regulator [Planctomycetota bacterium]
MQHLKAFVSVAEHGSITRAAEVLFSSQPAVSAQVKALEDDLGVVLFRRTGRGMVLTAEGQALLPRARRTLSDASGMVREAQRLRGEATGVLRVGVNHCGYDLRVAAISQRLVERFEAMELELVDGNSGGLTRLVIEEKVDVAFVEGDAADERLVDSPIGASRLGIIGPAKWRDDLTDSGWARLEEFPWVFQGPDCSYAQLMDRLSAEHGLSVRKQYRAEQFGAVHGLVAQGLAMSIADLDEAEPLVESGRVFVCGGYRYAMPVRLIALRARREEPAIAAFVEAALSIHGAGATGTGRRKARRVAGSTD